MYSKWRYRFPSRFSISISFLLLFGILLSLPTECVSQEIRNPYCDARTILYPNHPMGGQIAPYYPTGETVILIDPYVENRESQILRSQAGGRAFMRFMLAHECGHYELYHDDELNELQRMGPYALLAINPSLEADADCWAAENLSFRGDFAAIQAAADFFAITQGPFSHPGYPSGHERAQIILECGDIRSR